MKSHSLSSRISKIEEFMPSMFYIESGNLMYRVHKGLAVKCKPEEYEKTKLMKVILPCDPKPDLSKLTDDQLTAFWEICLILKESESDSESSG